MNTAGVLAIVSAGVEILATIQRGEEPTQAQWDRLGAGFQLNEELKAKADALRIKRAAQS